MEVGEDEEIKAGEIKHNRGGGGKPMKREESKKDGEEVNASEKGSSF